MKTVLITGFGPFPGVEDNPSEHLVRNLNLSFENTTVVSKVIPTEWARCKEMFEEVVASHRPDLLIHFGVHSNSETIHLERYAKNYAGNNPDACGACHTADNITLGTPTRLETTLPLDEMAKTLTDENFNTTVSDDAGDYLCNFLYYLSLSHLAENSKPDAALFVHIPLAPHAEAKLIEAAKALINLSVSYQTRLTGISAA